MKFRQQLAQNWNMEISPGRTQLGQKQDKKLQNNTAGCKKGLNWSEKWELIEH